MKRTLWLAVPAALAAGAWLIAQPTQPNADPLTDGFRFVEVASAADAMEQLYGQRAYMSHEMRPLSPAKFAGPAVTVLMKKDEHKEGPKASQGMLDAIDNAKPGSVYVMVLEDGGDRDFDGLGLDDVLALREALERHREAVDALLDPLEILRGRRLGLVHRVDARLEHALDVPSHRRPYVDGLAPHLQPPGVDA